MTQTINFFRIISKKVKSVRTKNIIVSVGIACFMLIGAAAGVFIHGHIGASFGLILGYVLGRSLII